MTTTQQDVWEGGKSVRLTGGDGVQGKATMLNIVKGIDQSERRKGDSS